MRTAALVLVVFTIGASSANLLLDSEWENFKVAHNKQFGSIQEHDARRAIFAENLKLINRHNAEYEAGLHTFTVGVNQYADKTNAEFVREFNGFQMSSAENKHQHQHSGVGLPKSVDWRKEGYVTPVKNQAQCGSCWAFAAVATMEGANFKKTGNLVSLSEQNLVDCVTKDYGCNGGLPADGVEYVIKNKGIDTEKSYPYTARDGRCSYSKNAIGATMSKVVAIKSGSEASLQSALATEGPVAVGIDASHFSFQFYSSGVYNERRCSTQQLDHGVTAVGYGTEDGKDYWLVKNSWGKSWGEQGYIKMARNNNNMCGIATMAIYAVA